MWITEQGFANTLLTDWELQLSECWELMTGCNVHGWVKGWDWMAWWMSGIGQLDVNG